MAESRAGPPDVAPLPEDRPPARPEVVLPLPAAAVLLRLIPWMIYGLALANILALWIARDDFVHGWDLFGATYGVLTLNEGSFADALSKFASAVLNQRNRPVFTGGESFIYGLVTGLLNTATPWLLWSHLWNLVLFVLVSVWIARRLKCAAYVYCACVLASPALVSNSIEGLPDLTSTAIPYGVSIAYFLSQRPEHRIIWGSIWDAVVITLIVGIAFNGYESGKTFFVVPAVAAFTLSGIPIVRRITWVACAATVAWLVHANEAMTTQTALQAVPHEPAAFARGVLASGREYFLTWYIDFPALAIAGFLGLPFLRENRPFWVAFLLVVLGLVSLNAFQFGGAFLIPHRFLLLAFVSVLIVSCTLSQQQRPSIVVGVSLLLAAGIGYTSYTPGRFVVTKRPDTAANWNLLRIYPLPYNRARLDNHLWVDRIQDAKMLVDVVKRGTEAHVVFYGFSAASEDSVNPQLFVSRILLPLGYEEFTRRVSFFDHSNHMYFRF